MCVCVCVLGGGRGCCEGGRKGRMQPTFLHRKILDKPSLRISFFVFFVFFVSKDNFLDFFCMYFGTEKTINPFV